MKPDDLSTEKILTLAECLALLEVCELYADEFHSRTDGEFPELNSAVRKLRDHWNGAKRKPRYVY